MLALSLLGACGGSTSTGDGEPDGLPIPGPVLGRSASALTLDEGLDAEERAFLTALNDHRAQNGLAPLQVSVSLSKAADFHSRQMADNNYFSHTLLNGVTWDQNLCDNGYCYATYKAENIAAGNAAGSATFTQWKNSSGHNANMLGANFKVVGIGRAYNANSTYKWYWTTTFGGYVDEVMTQGTSGGGTPTGTPRTEKLSGTVARGQSAFHGPFTVLAGTQLTVRMTGSGDPDLYVRFGAQPTLSAFDCRPYLTGASETCTLQVPAGQSRADVMVYGYSAGSYALDVSYTAP